MFSTSKPHPRKANSEKKRAASRCALRAASASAEAFSSAKFAVATAAASRFALIDSLEEPD
jgi:hypothetical protein